MTNKFHKELPTTNFTRSTNLVTLNEKLSVMSRMLYSIMASLPDTTVPNQTFLAYKLNISVKQITRYINELKEADLLVIIRTGKKSYDYFLKLPVVDDKDVTKDTPKQASQHTKKVEPTPTPTKVVEKPSEAPKTLLSSIEEDRDDDDNPSVGFSDIVIPPAPPEVKTIVDNMTKSEADKVANSALDKMLASLTPNSKPQQPKEEEIETPVGGDMFEQAKIIRDKKLAEEGLGVDPDDDNYDDTEGEECEVNIDDWL